MKTNYLLKDLLTVADTFINTVTGNSITWEQCESGEAGVKAYNFFEEGTAILTLHDNHEVIHAEDSDFILYEDWSLGECTFIRPIVSVDVAQFILNHSEDKDYFSEATIMKGKLHYIATGKGSNQ